jgi:hypothetical protein
MPSIMQLVVYGDPYRGDAEEVGAATLSLSSSPSNHNANHNNIPYNFLKEPLVYTILNEPLECCSIKLEPSEKTALTNKCRHKFSEEGLKRWLEVRKSCPLCRTDL